MTALAQGEQGRLAHNRGRRPLLRGWLHVVAFVGWLIGGPFLIAAGPDTAATAALAVYVAGMLAMFGTSAAFHRLRWSAEAWRRMRRADHSAIFVGIAGTATAVGVLALRGWAQVAILAMVWAGAAAGIALRQVWLDAPQWVVAIPYVVVGWCPLVVAPQLVRSLGWLGFTVMLLAGLAYTVGALVYARKRPDPWPTVFGFHEVFHACTLIGAGLFAYVIAFIALPRYQRRVWPRPADVRLNEQMSSIGVTIYGVCAVSFMMAMYALERRGRLFILLFALGCLLSSAYGFLSGAWPFGVVEFIWSGIAVRRWYGTAEEASPPATQ